jgi:pilus assembly protein Flp/PilA
MKTLFVRFVKNESGATAIEYGLIAAIMSVGIILGITALQGSLSTAFTNLGTTVTTNAP